MDLPDRSLIEAPYSWLIRKDIPYHSPPTDCGQSAPGLFVFSTCRKWPTLARRGNLPRLSGGAFCLTDRHHFFCLVPSQLPTTHYSAPMSDLGKIFAHFKFKLSRRLLHARIVSCLRCGRQFNGPWVLNDLVSTINSRTSAHIAFTTPTPRATAIIFTHWQAA